MPDDNTEEKFTYEPGDVEYAPPAPGEEIEPPPDGEDDPPPDEG